MNSRRIRATALRGLSALNLRNLNEILVVTEPRTETSLAVIVPYPEYTRQRNKLIEALTAVEMLENDLAKHIKEEDALENVSTIL